jgi:hypothetical protein
MRTAFPDFHRNSANPPAKKSPPAGIPGAKAPFSLCLLEGIRDASRNFLPHPGRIFPPALPG